MQLFRLFRHYLCRYPLTGVVTLAVWLLSLLPMPEQTPLDGFDFIDKWTHLVMYGGLTGTIWFEYLRRHRSQPVAWRRCLMGAGLLPVAMSGLLELLQEYATTYRSGEWFDLAANATGVALAWGAAACYCKLKS